ncbi:cyclohexanone monooxygenase [Arthrobacter bambusae]|uniref:Cyclohexanone monooxygenase n=1 Tax=Arthrobacter bambusae TaxID=1338426 RepID=A0ABV2P0V5_9MICC
MTTPITADALLARVPFDVEQTRQRYAKEHSLRTPPKTGARTIQPGTADPLGNDPWTKRDEREPITETVEVAIIGGGWAGLTCAVHLQKMGVKSLRIIEHGGDFGGVWYWNRYPGAQCDTESYVYFPFLAETGYMPSSAFPYSREIYEHAQRIGRHFNLYERTLFHTAGTSASWDDQMDEWVIHSDRGDVIRSRFLVRTNGALGNPTYPDVPGLETFPGKIFHSSRWDYDYTGGSPSDPRMTLLSDKRVAIIGSGASGVQCATALARDAGHLHVIQRTPSPIFGSRDVTPTDPRWFAGLKTGWQKERRYSYDANTSGRFEVEDLSRDQWTTLFRRAGLAVDIVEDHRVVDPELLPLVFELADMQIMHDMRTAVDANVMDPEVAEKLKPWFGFMCKRTTFDDGYFASFNRPNVSLVDAPGSGIDRVEGSTVFAGGEQFDVDCIIFATGFDTSTTTETRSGITVTGRYGVSLSQHHAEGLRTLHGLMSQGFPNSFSMGQGQGAITVNFTSILDIQAEHIAAIIDYASENSHTVVEPSADSVAEWSQTVADSGNGLRAYHSSCIPSYWNAHGDLAKGPLTSQIFTAGGCAFEEVLTGWRSNGGLQDLLVQTTADRKKNADKAVSAGQK